MNATSPKPLAAPLANVSRGAVFASFLKMGLLGFGGVDNKGLAGIENAFDGVLRGPNRKLPIQVDAYGREILREGQALPTETILSGIVMATPHKDEKVRKLLNRNDDLTPGEIFGALTTLGNTAIQLGGKATVGRGLCRVRLVGNGQTDREAGK